MDIRNIDKIYFIGIGGIGMSALARYFLMGGYKIAGYDRTPTQLTDELVKEGCTIHFKDDVDLIPEEFKSEEQKHLTLIVITPAIPVDHSELEFFQGKKYAVIKRSELLGLITRSSRGIAVAGTHGKTTVSTMIAHILKQSELDCTAFLGGISKNYNSNLITGAGNLTVVEADEYDRSFLQLNPFAAVITSLDADHLDIYQNYENLENAFVEFAGKINGNGDILIKKGLQIIDRIPKKLKRFTYSFEPGADFYSENLRIQENYVLFDAVTPDETIKDIHFRFPGRVNVENALAAIGMTQLLGVDRESIKKALLHFSGVMRRFDFQIRTDRLVYIDDYAHHPKEIEGCLQSLKEMFPGKKITGIFQPHLFTRTRDLANEFAQSLEILNQLILLDIYPAREEPIPGVTSELIFEKVKVKEKIYCAKEDLTSIIENEYIEVLVTMGAGDIDTLVPKIKEILLQRIERDNTS